MPQPSEREIEVFNVALELPAGERAAYLDQACAGDTALRQRVEELLKSSEGSCDFLESPDAVPTGPGGTVRISLLPAEKAGDRIGRYKLLQQIGEGGCGVVYMAEQEEPVRRRVALKVIKLGMDTKQVIARFEAERQALALMDHPNIAKVLEAGATETGRPYFVMELVRGIKITDYCDQNSLSTRERLDLFIQVCRAIQHAHQKGIIHRDIKPSNILVTMDDRAPVPKVIDFGIAKATQGKLTDHTLFTAFEQFIGTPAYMSPEQAEMRALDIDTRSDIYSLGVLLYELLTGQTPFDAKKLLQAGLDEIRRTIREQEPPRPSTCLSTMLGADLTLIAQHRKAEPPKLIHSLRGDLDWIVMKALEKDRARRYETANGLAADVLRHLSNEAVLARPPSRLYEFQKTVRRHRVGFAAAAGLILVLTGGVVMSTLEAIRATRAEAHARAQQTLARRSAEEANAQRAVAELEARRAKHEEGRANEQASLARRRFYAAQMNLASQASEAGQIPRVLELLETQRPQPGQEDLRGFDWYYMWGLYNVRHRGSFRGETEPVSSLAFSPDGKTLASASERDTIRLWDVATGNGQVLRGVEGTETIFTPDGQTLIAAGYDHLIRLWDVASGKVRATLSGHTDWVRSLAVAPDSKTFASGDEKGIVKLWDTTGHEKASVLHPRGPVLSASFSPDGRTLATASGWGTNGATGVGVLWDLDSGVPQPRLQFAEALSLAFSPDSRTLVAAEGNIRLYDAASGKQQASLAEDLNWGISVACLPDGKTLVSASRDRTIRLWRLPSASEPTAGNTIIGAHLEPALCVGVSGDGKLLASGANDGSIELWDLSKAQEQLDAQVAVSVQAGEGLEALLFSQDGNTLFAVTDYGTSLIDQVSGLRYAELPAAASHGALSPDGKLLATANRSAVRLWDLASGKLLRSVEAHRFYAIALAFSPDGRTLVSGGYDDSTVRLWDTATLKPIGAIATPSASVSTLAFSPDGRTLAAGNQDNSVILYDPSTGRERLTLDLGGGFLWVGATAFSHDGKVVAAGGGGGIVKVWDAQTGKLRIVLKGHTGSISAIAFSPDDDTLASCGSDRTVRLWDAVSGQERITLKGLTNGVDAVAFAPDGNTLAVGSTNGLVRLWRARRDLKGFAPADLAQDDEHARLIRTRAEVLARSKWSQAEIANREEVALRRKQAGNDDPETLYALRNLAGALEGQGNWAESEALHREELAFWRKRAGNDDPQTLYTLHMLGWTLEGQSKWSEAENVYREEVELRRKQAGNDDPETLYALRNLARALEGQDKWAEAETLHREALASWRKRAGNDDPQTLYTLGRLGWTLEEQSKWSEAEDVYRETLASRRKGAGNEAPQTLSEIESLTRVLILQKKFGETEQLLKEALTPAIVRQPSSCNLLVQRVELMGRQGRWQEAAVTATLVVEYQPTEQYRYHTLAALLAITENRPVYETVCRRILATFTNTTNPYVDERIAKDCLLLPDSGVDLKFVDELADKAVSLGSGWSDAPYFQAAKAMSAYRLGHFAEAIEWAGKTLKSDIIYANAHAYAILAVAHWELGHKDVARAMLDKGDSLTPNILPAHQAVDFGDSWVAWLLARISLDEASALIQPASKTESNSQKP